jgi:phage-related protein
MKRKGIAIQYWLAALALGTLISVAPAKAQSPGAAPPDRDADLTHQQLAAFDQFLDNHPELSEQLRKDPSLVSNQEFVNNHPDLQRYLQEHPEVREDLNQNPSAVMNQEQRFDRREDRDADRDRDRGGERDRNSDITRGELSNMDRFMDSHPEIAEQLRKNPALVDNKQFVQDHPALQEFLASHPGVREEMKENPNAFMHREERFDRREDGMRDRDVTRGELANMDRFMDSHPEIAEQMRKDPSLVNNKEFVANHPALQEFLASHPGVREEYRENPNAFMRQEQRFDRREDGMRDRDVTRGELSSFHEFLERHNNISGELSKNPSLATNQEYLENHPALRDYLKTNPKVNEELGENPQSFVKSAQQFDMSTKATTKPAPKPLADPKLK